MAVGRPHPFWQNSLAMQSPAPPKPEPLPPDGAKRPEPGMPAHPAEQGGPPGPDPTRYGDWEKAGRCIDF